MSPTETIFDPDGSTEEQTTGQLNTLDALLIQTTRCYDALMMLLSHFDEESAAFLSNYHEAGQVMSPNPALLLDDSEVTQE